MIHCGKCLTSLLINGSQLINTTLISLIKYLIQSSNSWNCKVLCKLNMTELSWTPRVWVKSGQANLWSVGILLFIYLFIYLLPLLILSENWTWNYLLVNLPINFLIEKMSYICIDTVFLERQTCWMYQSAKEWSAFVLGSSFCTIEMVLTCILCSVQDVGRADICRGATGEVGMHVLHMLA